MVMATEDDDAAGVRNMLPTLRFWLWGTSLQASNTEALQHQSYDARKRRTGGG